MPLYKIYPHGLWHISHFHFLKEVWITAASLFQLLVLNDRTEREKSKSYVRNMVEKFLKWIYIWPIPNMLFQSLFEDYVIILGVIGSMLSRSVSLHVLGSMKTPKGYSQIHFLLSVLKSDMSPLPLWRFYAKCNLVRRELAVVWCWLRK